MCKAFSCIAVRSKKVYWKLGIDAHNELVKHFRLNDDKKGVLCPIEVTPDNGDYIFPDKWTLEFDDKCPDWWKQGHEKAVWNAHTKWVRIVHAKVYKNRIKNMVNPLELPIVEHPNKSQIQLLAVWASVGDSVRDSFMAYVGSMFKLESKQWKYTKNLKINGYPFMSSVKLWKQGLVPSFDGKVWRLHSGKKAKVVFEISKDKLQKMTK